VLDHRLRVHPRAGIRTELLHRRRTPEPDRRRAERLEDLLVGVPPSDPRLELGKGLRIDAGNRPVGLLPRHTKNGRAN
jgi:hypothetical protein